MDLGAQRVYVTRFIKRYKPSPAAPCEQETPCSGRATEHFKPSTSTCDELASPGIQPCVPCESNKLVGSGVISDGGRVPLNSSDQNSIMTLPLATVNASVAKPSGSIALRTRAKQSLVSVPIYVFEATLEPPQDATGNNVWDTATDKPPVNDIGEGTVNLDGENGDCETGHDDEEDSTSDDAEFDEDEDEEEDESDDDDDDGSEAEDDDDYDDDPEPDESDDDGPFADDRDEESEVEYARQNQRTKAVTGSKPIASRRQRDLLAKRSRAVFSFTVRNLDSSTLREERSVKVFKDDIMTLKPFGWLSDVVIDYAIYKCMESTGGTVKRFGASLFSQFKQAKSGGESSFSDVKKLVDKIDWDLYFAVLFPVWGDNHWSLLVVEEPAKSSRCMFHESSHVFSIATKLLAAVCEVTSDGSPTVSVCETHPQQKKNNNSDCGIYMLYYMEKIAVYLSQNKTKSIQSEIKKLTSGLNIGSSAAFGSVKFTNTLFEMLYIQNERVLSINNPVRNEKIKHVLFRVLPNFQDMVTIHIPERGVLAYHLNQIAAGHFEVALDPQPLVFAYATVWLEVFPATSPAVPGSDLGIDTGMAPSL
ncbi:hypothetical protein F442_17430 [Phytophthora nicotianae P10297]|uniref:Ubiquitin-like protease family profile domain-containing protein n=1 Tax=Phytophthora nicotianae P10297 TaxID=1317064 RepID=W2YHU9_PHYNI|nr:hypothetical protein F442_17430 [Phytophthora nicotianae P10297]